MNVSRQFLLGLLLLGLPAAAAAAEPAPPADVDAPQRAPAAATPLLTAPAYYSSDVFAGAGPAAAGRAGWVGGVGLYLMQPYFDNNMSMGVDALIGTVPPRRVDARIEVNNHTEVAPLLWLGYMGESGWGARARWWYFRQGTSQTEAAKPPGQTTVTLISAAPLGLSLTSTAGMNVTTKLEVQAADLEGLSDYAAGNWDFLLAAGVRLAHISQAYNAFVARAGQNTLLSGHSMHGAGPTLAVEARRSLGDSGLSLYASVRGSYVFGSAHQSATQPDQNVAAVDNRNIGLPIGEVELGIEYNLDLGGARLFGQVALVGQDWVGAGSASRSSVNVLPGGAFFGGAYVGDSDIDFLGVAIRLGLNY